MESKRFIGKVFRHFRILEPLGHGGMGLVFKALNTHLNKIVAIKMIAPGLALNEKLLNRFKTEALALARLENPHIVRILDLLEDQGQWFIVMEYIEGETLQQRLKDKHPLRLSEAFDITLQILSALQHAHSASIIHRDIKPSNILITKDNTVKVTDFGLAKIQANTLVHTQHSAVGGTLYYMSPEQIRSLKETDHRTDIYSLGITIYQMITGRIPFDPHQTDFDIREAIVRRQFPKPSTFNPYLPPEVDDLVMKAIAKNPDDRFQSAVEMIQEMERLQDKLKGKLDQEIKYDSDIEKEINYTDYPFNIQEDFSDEASKLNIPVDKNASPLNNGPKDALMETSAKEPPPASPQAPAESFWQRGKRYWWLSLFPVAIIAFILYYFLAFGNTTPEASLNIDSQPEQADVFINGRIQGKTPITNLKVAAGSLHVSIQKSGFLPADTSVFVKKGQNLAFRLKLQPAKLAVIKIPAETTKVAQEHITTASVKPAAVTILKLSFSSQPKGADIFINNKRFGKTPLAGKFKEEQRLIVRLQKSGFQTLIDTVFVTAKGKHHFNYVLLPKPVKLTITTNVNSAHLLVDGQKFRLSGKSKTLTLLPGLHVVSVNEAGYASQQKSIKLKVNTPRRLSFNLIPLKSKLQILVLPWGNIYIDGQLKKKESNIRETFVLPVGKHSIKVTHPVLGQCEQTVNLKPDTTLSLIYNFKKPEPIRILAFDTSAKPQYAQIIVDGKPVDQYTPGVVKLTIGRHQISVHKEGFTVVDGDREVMVLPDKNLILKFKLRKNR